MGITIKCKKSGHDIDMGCGGFLNLRTKIAYLVSEEVGQHYESLMRAPLFDPERTKFFDEHDARTEELIKSKTLPIKIADFLYQCDAEGGIHYGACKMLLKVIGDYDNNIIYGYAGRENPAKFADFKKILQECADLKCDMVWE